MFKQKTEVIDFKTFLAGNHVESKGASDITLYSGLLPTMSVERFFDMSPQMTGLYVLVLSAGAFAILSHLIEVGTAKNGMSNVAYVVETVTRFIMPVSAFGFMVWALFKIV